MFDFKEGLKNNSDALIGLGAGLLGGRTGQEQLSGALTGFAQGRKTNSTMMWLEGQSPELAEAMRSGAIDGKTAVDLFWQKKLQSEKPAGFMNVGGVLVNDRDGSMVADYRQPKTDNTPHYKTIGPDEAAQYGAPPGHYQVNEQTNELKPLKVNDPNAPPPLTVADRRAIMEADEQVMNNQAAIDNLTAAEKISGSINSGYTAGARSFLANNLPDVMVPDRVSSPESAAATSEYDNLIMGSALNQLKSIFGAAPTEGERQILLDLQASSKQPPKVRAGVLARAKDLARKRLEFNQQRAEELRGGTFYSPTGAGAGAGGANSASTGINWRVK